MNSAWSQDKSVIDRLGAARVKSQTVYTKFDPVATTYTYTDASGVSQGSIGTDQYFAYSGGNIFHVKVAFLNPLRYKVEVTSTSVSNPTSLAYDDFLKAFSTAFTGIDQVAAIGATQNLVTKATGRAAGPKFVPKVRTILLSEWYYKLVDSGLAAHTQAKDDELQTLVTALEQVLFGKVTLSGEPDSRTVDEWLVKFKTDLFNAASLKDFDSAHNTVTTSVKELNTHINAAKKAYDEIKKILQVGNGSYLVGASDNFTNYSLNTLGNFTRTVDPIIAGRLTKVNEFDTYMKSLKQTIVDYKDHPLTMEKRKDLKVKINITEFDVNGKELEKKYASEFHVIYFQPLVPYFSAAFAWSPHKFYNYTLVTEGTGSVIQETTEKRYWQPAVFVNWFLNIKQEDIHFILPQIGVGTGGELPIFYTGLGVAIRERLAFTGGYSYAFEKQLKTKKAGDTVADEATLKGDLTREISARGYLSLTYRIGN